MSSQTTEAIVGSPGEINDDESSTLLPNGPSNEAVHVTIERPTSDSQAWTSRAGRSVEDVDAYHVTFMTNQNNQRRWFRCWPVGGRHSQVPTSSSQADAYMLPPKLKHSLEEHVVSAAVRLGAYYTLASLIAIPVLVILGFAYVLAFVVRWMVYVVRRGGRCWGRNSGDGSRHFQSERVLGSSCDPYWPLTSLVSSASSSGCEISGNCNGDDKVNFTHAVVTLHSRVDLADIRQLIWTRVVHLQNSEGRLLYPRFSQRYTQRWGGPVWIDDPDFDIQNHITLYASPPMSVENNEETEHSPKAQVHSLQDLEGYLNRVTHTPANYFDRPPWEITVILDFGETRCTLLLFRLHSGITEQLCLPKMLCLLNDTDLAFIYEPRLDATFSQQFWCIGQALFLQPLEFLKAIFRDKHDDVWTVLRQKMTNDKVVPQNDMTQAFQQPHVVTWARIPSVDQLLRAEKLLHCTTEELFLSFIAGALQRHLKTQGIRYPPDLYTAVPIPLKRGTVHVGREECCTFSVVPFRLPVSVDGCIPRVWEVQRRMEDLLDGPLPHGLWASGHVWRTICLKGTWARRAQALPLGRSSCVISFLRGSPNPRALLSQMTGGAADVSMCAHRVHSILQFCPLPAGVPAAFTFIQLGREIVLSLRADVSLFPSPDALLVNFQREIQKLLQQISGRLLTPLIAAALLPAKPAFSVVRSKPNLSVAASQKQNIDVSKNQPSENDDEVWSGEDSYGGTSGLHASRSTASSRSGDLDSVLIDHVGTPVRPLSCPVGNVDDVSLEELENLLATIQAELLAMRQQQHSARNREANLVKLAQFEGRMLQLQASIAEKLRQNGHMLFMNDREGGSALEAFLKHQALPPPASPVATSLFQHARSRSEQEGLFSLGQQEAGSGSHRQLKRKRSRRTSSPTAVNRENVLANSP